MRLQVILFHQKLRDFCKKHEQDYQKHKQKCDEYFYLPHRQETRGIGGLFFDQLENDTKQKNFKFVEGLGNFFTELYLPFILENQSKNFTEQQKEFQELRRSRYVEFNLLYDRGTHFGLQSQGRVESILVSMPKIARWQYQDEYQKGTPEYELLHFYLHPQNWVELL